MSLASASRLAELRAALGGIAPVVTGGAKRVVLFLSWTDGSHRAEVRTVVGCDADDAWTRATALLEATGGEARWLRAEWVDAVERTSWGALRARLGDVKRNYFRLGISLDAGFEQAFLETEINANAMLYGGPREPAATINERNFRRYAERRHGLRDISFGDERPLWLFTTRGAFSGDEGIHAIDGKGVSSGRRSLPPLDAEAVTGLIGRGSAYLASQVGEDGRFAYGWHPCFDRPIAAYNSLRHASTLYAMIEAWEVTRDRDLGAAIERSLAYLTGELIADRPLPGGDAAAFLVDAGEEVKLGGNAVAILALVKYRDLTGDTRHDALCERLARTIVYMQNDVSGRFVHVLHYPSLAVKQPFRTIYYDGEAAFALVRLFGITGNIRWLEAVERAFLHFVRERHWTAHDHWLSYCVNELTIHDPSEVYFRFGLDNVRDYLEFVAERITTFPTLLELMMATERMIARLRGDPALAHLLDGFDIARFYEALHLRANYLVNGHFWPELAMFYARPERIAGSFFIRHHGFRVRIDDVEHYLSGLVAYRRYLMACEAAGGFAHEKPIRVREDIGWTADHLVRATGGEWVRPPSGGWTASGLCIAPVTMRKGDMVAVRLREGEVGVDVRRIARLPEAPAALIAAGGAEAVPDGAPLLRVGDVGGAILDLGRYARQKLSAQVLAVTGSAGKTTAVAMLAHALAPYGEVAQTRHNANLPHGIAWNLASIRWDVPHVVLELAIGRMARNARLARPDVAIFTNILPAHLEYHRDLDTVAARKSAIFGGMKPGGTAVLNRDMAQWEQVHMAATIRGLRIVHYGRSPDCHFRLLAYDPASGEVHASIFGSERRFRLGAAGEHMALNSLAVLAAVAAAGQDIDAAIASLASFVPVAGRGDVHRLTLGGRRVTLLDDSYNANPGSMATAFALLRDMDAAGRKVALLGEMRELGPDAAAYHAALAPLVTAAGIARVHAVGDLYDDFWSALAANQRGLRARAPEDIETLLLADLRDGDVLLVKGSHGSRVHELAERLRHRGAMPQQGDRKAHEAVAGVGASRSTDVPV